MRRQRSQPPPRPHSTSPCTHRPGLRAVPPSTSPLLVTPHIHGRTAFEEHLLEGLLLTLVVLDERVLQGCLEINHRPGRTEIRRGRRVQRFRALSVRRLCWPLS